MAVLARRRTPLPAPSGEILARLLRSRRLVQRNLLVYKHSWLIFVSGFFEPLFYLLGIGFGLGSIIGSVEIADGRTVPYGAFVAPALLATASMNGAVSETIFNVFFKLNFNRTYEGVLATPLGITEIAIGELIWALIRAFMYAAAFVVVMLALGLVLSPWALLALPAALVVSAAFSAAGLAATSYLRTVQDFDIPMGLVVMPMFLFSGTFFPISVYPEPVQWIMQATPLYHGVALLRGLTTGAVDLSLLWHLGYLLAFFAIGLTIAVGRLERKLIK